MQNGIEITPEGLMEAYDISEGMAEALIRGIYEMIGITKAQSPTRKFDATTVIRINATYFTVFAHVHPGCPAQGCLIKKFDTLEEAEANEAVIIKTICKVEAEKKEKQLTKYHKLFKN